MRYCHACQQELDAASLAAGRCANCGAVIRPLAKRTVEDKRSLRGPKVGAPGAGGASGDQPPDPSIDIESVDPGRAGATIELSPNDTTRVVAVPGPTTPPIAQDPN